ncbi:MAG: GspE/PulE family protein [Patescibacteria group bacterium]
MHIVEEKLKSIFKKSGLVDDKVFESAKEESLRSSQTIADVLIGRGTIPEDYMVELLQPYFGAKIVDLKKIIIPPEILELVPESYAKSKKVIIFEIDKENNIVKAAMIDPLDYDVLEFLRAKLDAWVEPHLTTQSSLKYGLKQYKKKINLEFNKIIAENIEKTLSVVGEPDLNKMAEAVPIITILDSIIEQAVILGASDIHFEPLAKEVLIRYRVDGVMQEILSLPKIIAPILVARVKVLASLLIDEHRLPQDGRFKFELEDISIDIRVNIMPVFHGEKVEMRILKSSARPIGLEELGLSKKAVDLIYGEIKKTHGMILVTGPTGHGKTTTLYSILQILNTSKVNITTIEDPIEYEISRINQTQVNTKAGITFANGLRSLLRQNPDIIMIGEIRDNETVDIAVHSALTGHLVLSSLHTNDAASALPRLLDMGAPAFLLSSTVNMIVAQRLVRKICSFCIESYPITPEIKRLIMAQLSAVPETPIKAKNLPTRLFRGKGCKICNNSGFHGQIGVFEVLRVTDSIRELLLKLVPVGEIRKRAIKEGMTTLFEDGLDKVERGTTTIEEVLRVIRE